MLSYPWKYQKLFIYLKQRLQGEGYTVWMDIDQMSQSVLEAMAGAVEGAAVIVFCLSSAYKESEACRTEAEYSYNKRKAMIPVKAEAGYQPDGWLGALVGNKLYFDFSKGEAMYAEKFDQLLKEIERHGVGKAGQGVSAPSAGGDASTAALKKQLGEAEQMIKDLQRQLQQATAGGVSTTTGTASTAPSGSSELGQVMNKLNDIEGKLAALAYTIQNQPRAENRSRACSVL
jgi:hypothetical protein